MEQSETSTALKAWRLSCGLTLDAAAASVGTVRQVWYDWETGRRRPGADALQRIYLVTDGAVEPNDFYPLPLWRRALDAARARLMGKAA
jgi:transcriptional regulator with XRE-family HTH domain